MSPDEIIKIANAILISLGGGGIIVFALSSWLGKVWANRIMAKDRSEYSKDLEKLRADLARENDKELSGIKADLDIYKEKHLKSHTDKIEIYRLVTDVVSDLLGDFDLMEESKEPLTDGLQRWDRFNRGRMRAYGYLAMLAPQNVVDAYDALFDHLICIYHGHEPYEWAKVRELAINLVNQIRKDIDIDSSPIEYRGRL